jgi:hypothetical protein
MWFDVLNHTDGQGIIKELPEKCEADNILFGARTTAFAPQKIFPVKVSKAEILIRACGTLPASKCSPIL